MSVGTHGRTTDTEPTATFARLTRDAPVPGRCHTTRSPKRTQTNIRPAKTGHASLLPDPRVGNKSTHRVLTCVGLVLRIATSTRNSGKTNPNRQRSQTGAVMSLPDIQQNKNLQGNGFRARVQRFGGQLAGMIMPNIGAFIAWGLLTALFIPNGWMPNETLATMVGPIITYLLPVLIGYTGGRMVHGQRGAVIGAVATMGVVVGADIPMFLGAMIVGPASAWLLKQFDKLVAGRVRTGFEMLVDNFSLGIIGLLAAVAARLAIGPVVEVLVKALGAGVEVLVNHGLLPLASIIVEPAKVLFLNNAINHGVLSPLGAAEAQQFGKSILFMVESNPGPGLGILLAFWLFGNKALRGSAPRRGDHPPVRWHPRDLLPLRPGPPDHAARGHRWWHERPGRRLPAGCRPGRTRLPGQHPRLLPGDPTRWLLPNAGRSPRRHRRILRHRSRPARLPSSQGGRRRTCGDRDPRRHR